MRIICLACLALTACTDLPDHDDPREAPAEISCTNMLVNGDFDHGATMMGWMASSPDIIVDDRKLTNNTAIHAESDHFLAWLGGVVSGSRSIAQHINVPAGVTKLRLDGKVFVAVETAGQAVQDKLDIQITDQVGNVLSTARTLTNLDPSDPNATFVEWKDLHVDIPVAAQQVMLRLISTNDASNNTNFFFDTLSLLPASCP